MHTGGIHIYPCVGQHLHDFCDMFSLSACIQITQYAVRSAIAAIVHRIDIHPVNLQQSAHLLRRIPGHGNMQQSTTIGIPHRNKLGKSTVHTFNMLRFTIANSVCQQRAAFKIPQNRRIVHQREQRLKRGRHL